VPPTSSPRPLAILTLAALVLLGGCYNPAPDPRRSGPGVDDCLRDVKLNQLKQAIRRCDAVVDAHPRAPQPRNERALLHSLAGQQEASCRDSRAASALLQRQPKGTSVDTLMVEEIRLRLRSCEPLTSPPAAGAPSGQTSGAARP
jgi:hypothetical protein